jgi:DNA-directed RNA polymerase subunit omega
LEDHKVVDSKFRLVILASKRAKQLLHGGKKKVEMNAENPLSIALEEIKQGKIDYEIILNEDEDNMKTGEEMVNGENEIAEESLSESDLEEEPEEEETDTEDEDDAEVVAESEEKQPD